MPVATERNLELLKSLLTELDTEGKLRVYWRRRSAEFELADVELGTGGQLRLVVDLPQ